jgi:hypothetical protein
MLKPEAYALSRRFYALSRLLEAPPGGAALFSIKSFQNFDFWIKVPIYIFAT